MSRPSTMADLWTTVGPTIASLMFLSAVLRQYCPYELRRFLENLAHRLTSRLRPYVRITVHEFSGDRLSRSEAFLNVEAYLSSTAASNSANRLRVTEIGKDSSSSSTKLVLTMDEFERVTDEFRGAKVSWILSKTTPVSSHSSSSYGQEQEKRFYKLSFHKKYRDIVTESYLGFVIKQGKEIRVRSRQRKLYTNSPGYKWPSYKQTMWSHIVFEHPATFETMALEKEKKREIVEDLLTFSQSREFYERIGKAWKRGYLLYGPPGTGKSTMIAAMANYLGYDVYDLELTAVKDNTELRKLLIETTSKSIIVIEDIDCSLDLTGQRKRDERFEDEKSLEGNIINNSNCNNTNNNNNNNNVNSRVTLSGLLNFIDGLWSACGGERLIVFTTNYVEKLDPALIRRGRMDKHIELSYCSFEGFKVLANNYLRLESHEMFGHIEKLIGEVRITPADVAENLMPKTPLDGPEKCLCNLIRALEEVAAAAAEEEQEAEALKEVEPILAEYGQVETW